MLCRPAHGVVASKCRGMSRKEIRFMRYGAITVLALSVSTSAISFSSSACAGSHSEGSRASAPVGSTARGAAGVPSGMGAGMHAPSDIHGGAHIPSNMQGGAHVPSNIARGTHVPSNMAGGAHFSSHNAPQQRVASADHNMVAEQQGQRDLAQDREFAKVHEADFHTRDVHEFNHEEFARWREGRWHNAWHHGRYGWWWRVHGNWYWYQAPLYPYPLVVVPLYVDTPVEGPELVPLPPIDPLPAPVGAESYNSDDNQRGAS